MHQKEHLGREKIQTSSGHVLVFSGEKLREAIQASPFRLIQAAQEKCKLLDCANGSIVVR